MKCENRLKTLLIQLTKVTIFAQMSRPQSLERRYSRPQSKREWNEIVWVVSWYE